MLSEIDIKNAVQRIVDRFDPKRIIVFGSYAYGVPTEESDLDLMVVDDGSIPSPKEFSVSKALFPRDFGLDVICISEDELAKRKAMSIGIIDEILTHGKIVYERQ